MYVCVCERECVCVSLRARERVCVYLCECVCVCERERESVCVCFTLNHCFINEGQEPFLVLLSSTEPRCRETTSHQTDERRLA